MSETYSLAVTGLRADSQFTAKPLTLPDSACQGLQTSTGAMGLLGQAAASGGQVFCKRNDGSFGWYTVDAERSTAANPVLKAV